MKKLITILIIVALTLVAAFATPILMKNPGLIAVEFAGYIIEMRVITAVALLAVFIFLIWLLVYFLRLPKKTIQNYTSNRSRKSFAKGLLALSEGKWKRAEKLLVLSTKNSPTPELGFMAAARAAVALNNIDGAFRYLDEAENNTDNPLTVDLTRCELWIKTGDNEKALSLLNRIVKSYPNNPRALYLISQASQNAGQWQRLREILPKTKKLGIISEEKILQLTQHSIQQQLNQAESKLQLQSTWDSLDKQQKREYDYIHAYAESGLKLGMYKQVAALTEKTLHKNFSDPLLTIWGQLNINNDEKIKTAEKWLNKNPENPELLKILGRLCLENKLWGKAQSYLQKSLEIHHDEETFKLMAHYFDSIGESENALEAYRQAEGTRNQLVLVDESK